MSLHDAVRARDFNLVADILKADQDVNRQDPDGLRPLMIAAAHGDRQITQLLLEAGADVHAVDPFMGATALHKAALSGDADVICLLLKYRAFADQQSSVLGHTPLMDAVQHGQESAVKALLQNGARTDVRNHYGENAIDLALNDGFEVAVKILKDAARALVEQKDTNEFGKAVRSGDLSTVRKLLASKVPVDTRTPIIGSHDDNYTPLGLAARDGHPEIVQALLEAGADIRLTNGLMGGLAWHEAAYWGRTDVISVLRDVHGFADVSAAGIDVQGHYNGYTALHDAIWRGNDKTALALVEAGARIDLKSHAGKTPLDLASRIGSSLLVRILGSTEGFGRSMVATPTQ